MVLTVWFDPELIKNGGVNILGVGWCWMEMGQGWLFGLLE